MFKELISILLIVGCVAAGPQIPRQKLNRSVKFTERNGRIVGGRNATIEEFPFQVAMFFRNVLTCGGAILNANSILSAAHCTYEEVATDFAIRAGSSEIGAGGQFIRANRIIEHELFDEYELTNDIAILKLEQNLVFSASVRPIRFPSQNFNVPHGNVASISGWGDLEFQGHRYPEVLQTARVPVIGNSQCNLIYDDQIIRPDQLCAGDTERDACQGDSGGPLIFQGLVVGIVSWGYGCAMDWPTVYTRVSEYLPFIVRNL